MKDNKLFGRYLQNGINDIPATNSEKNKVQQRARKVHPNYLEELWTSCSIYGASRWTVVGSYAN